MSEEDNLGRYIKQPSKAMVRSVAIKVGRSMRKFEKIWGMPDGTCRQYIGGWKPFPAKYWHLIYEYRQINKLSKGEFTEIESTFKHPLQNKIIHDTEKFTAPKKNISQEAMNTLEQFRQKQILHGT